MMGILQRNPAAMVEPGSVVGVKRRLYDHYGVLAENGDVFHYTSEGSDIGTSNSICRTSFERFLRGERSVWTMIFPTKQEAERMIGERVRRIAALLNGNDPFSLLPLVARAGEGFIVEKMLKAYRLYSRQEVQSRAISRLGESSYNLVTRNCEHFAFWCATGISASQQVEAFLNGGIRYVSYTRV